jgi:selenocysteine lyase/cysteine desulfurase
MLVAEWWEVLRSRFPLCSRRAYLFAGAQSPLSIDVRAAIHDFLDLWEERVWRFEQTEWRSFDQAAELLGSILECDPSRVAATESTSHAMNLATAMVLARWSRGGRRPANVVLSHESHPASSYAWVNSRRLGASVELRWPIPEPGQDPADALADSIDERTIAVVASHVSNVTGERLDVSRLTDGFPDRQFALMLDAAQSAGALPLHAEVDGCDFVGIPAYKWLFGPPGFGFLVSRESWLDDIGPPFAGWASVKDVMTMDPRRMDLAQGGVAFRLGIPNFMGAAGAAAGLKLWSEAGGQRISARIHDLTDRFLRGLGELGHSTPTPTDWPRRAGVIAVDLRDPERVMADLLEVGIEVGVELTRLRVDPHAYNTEEEIDRLLDRLAEVPPVSTVAG